MSIEGARKGLGKEDPETPFSDPRMEWNARMLSSAGEMYELLKYCGIMWRRENGVGWNHDLAQDGLAILKKLHGE